MVLIELTSDNFHQELLTIEAYEAITLSMSTGDYATHKAVPFVCPDPSYLNRPVYSFMECQDGIELIDLNGENQ
jgi:hypothetical protein